MIGRLRDLPRDVREQTAAAVLDRQTGLAQDIASMLAEEPGLDAAAWRDCGIVLLDLLTLAIEEGEIDSRRGAIHDLSLFAPPLSIRDIIHAAHRVERVVLDELALNEQLGATSEPWPVVAHSVRAATLEVIGAFAEREGAHPPLRDPLTTLVSRAVFDMVLAQETYRAHRHEHGVAMLLFDIDNLSQLNASHGYGAGSASWRGASSARMTGWRATATIRSA